ncbi:MAG: hypothetical protein ACOYM3_17735 [Terrimicrobiaceae bacterium]
MKPPFQPGRQTEGTIMIFALVIILAGTLVLLGWAQMMATAAAHPDSAAEGMKNRITYENSRALARQFLLASLPSGANNYGSATNDWWQFEIYPRGQTNTSFWTNTNQAAGNPFSPFGGLAFVVTNTEAFVYYGTNRMTNQFLVKSRSPLLAGYGLVQHQAASETNLTTNRIYYTETKGFNGSPQVPFTSGTTASGVGSTNGYLGYFASPMNTHVAADAVTGITYVSVTGGTTSAYSTNGRRYTNYSNGNISIVLNSTQANSFLRYTITNAVNASFTNGTNITSYANTRVTNFILTGTTNTNTLHLILDSNNVSTTNITLRGTNNSRRVYLNDQSSSITNIRLRTETTTNSYRWWFGVTLSNSELTIAAPSGSSRSLTLTNGIRSDRNVNLQSGALNLVADPNPTLNSEIIADRVIWIEDGIYR